MRPKVTVRTDEMWTGHYSALAQAFLTSSVNKPVIFKFKAAAEDNEKAEPSSPASTSSTSERVCPFELDYQSVSSGCKKNLCLPPPRNDSQHTADTGTNWNRVFYHPSRQAAASAEGGYLFALPDCTQGWCPIGAWHPRSSAISTDMS